MGTLYWVKFLIEGTTTYGVLVPSYDRKKFKVRKGFVPVEDAIFPVYHEVKKTELKECSCDDYCKYLDKEFKKALKVSESYPVMVMPGKVFCIPMGDGFAWYIVTKVDHGKKTCDVEHRGFSVDEWYDHYYGIGRKGVLISDVLPHVKRMS
jgi:hypothetical protein